MKSCTVSTHLRSIFLAILSIYAITFSYTTTAFNPRIALFSNAISHSSSRKLTIHRLKPLRNEVLSTSLEPLSTDQTMSTDKDTPLKNITDTNSLDDGITNSKKLLTPLDIQILRTAIPSMLNLAVVPIVNSVDTFWVGQMGVALALAGQAAANQAFFTIFLLISFVPNITAPLVAQAVGSGDKEAAQDRVCESIFLSNLLGGIGTLLLFAFPQFCLKMVLSESAPAMAYAEPYLRWRSLSLIPALFAATGFAAYRGMLNTVTPLKVSLFTNTLNLILDPLFIFGGAGVVGAAFATALSEISSGLIYFKLLLRQKLVRWSKLLKPPKWSNLLTLLKGGMAMLLRQLTLNVAILSAARRAQLMDPSGVSAAAYGIVMQIYSVGIVVHVAMQGTAAALVSSSRAAEGDDAARKTADRLFFWGTLTGLFLGIGQLLALPVIVPLFSTLPEVREAVKVPALISSLIHVINGPVLVGEGCMMGVGSFGALTGITVLGVGSMVAGLMAGMGQRLDGILWSLALFCFVQGIGVVSHYLKISPLTRKKHDKEKLEQVSAMLGGIPK